MPGDIKPILTRRMKGAKKARREALGLPDPEPTPRRKRKYQKGRRQPTELTEGKGHVCHHRWFATCQITDKPRFVESILVTRTIIDGIDR